METENLSGTGTARRSDGRRQFVVPLVTAASVMAVTLGAAAWINSGHFAETAAPAAAGAVPSEISADTENNPPKTLIAAGRVALSAYWIGRWDTLGERDLTIGTTTVHTTVKRLTRAWWLYNSNTKIYEATHWSWVDVAPGLKKAAVLQGQLPTKRLGILDMKTRVVTTWIDLPRPAASVSWSPDGTNVLATAYDANPDEANFKNENTKVGKAAPSPRTGVILVDGTTGKARFHPVRPTKVPFAPKRNDFQWVTSDLLSSGGESDPTPGRTNMPGKRAYFKPDGTASNIGQGQVDSTSDEVGQAGLSPSGRLVAGPAGLPTKVTDNVTGEVVGSQPALELLAWADDDNLVALGCEGECSNEFHNGLILVSLDGKHVTRLSAYREDGGSDTTWHPVLTAR